ncbi:MAG: AsmA family protein [Pseudomonadota bacterium]
MKRFIKWIFILALLLVTALVAAPFFIPLDNVKKIASEKIKEMTGRDLIIAGDIKASMWPNIGVTLKQVSLSNPEGYSSKNMAEIGDITIAVALMPLLQKEVQVKEFIINKPIIHLEINKQGVANWEFQSQKTEKTESADAPVASSTKDTNAPLPSLGKIVINDGNFTYSDLQTGKKYNVSDASLDIGMPSPNSPLDVAAKLVFNKEQIKLALHAEQPFKLAEGGDSKIKTDIKIGSLISLVFDGKASMSGASGSIDLNSSSLVALSGLTGKKMDWKGDTALAFSQQGSIVCSTSECSLSKAKITLDDAVLNGDMKINFAGGVPSIEAKLASDKINLNHYLPKDEKQASLSLISEAHAAPQGWDTKPINLSGLKAVNAKISLEVASLLYQATTLSKLSLNLQLQNGALAVNIPHVGFYGGTAKVSATANASNAISANLDINNVQIEPLLKDFAEFDRLTGTANLTTSITGHGASQRDIVSSLNGKGNIKVNDGEIRGVNIAQLVSNAKAMVTGADTSGDKTKFSELSGSYTIAQGIVKNDDLAMKAPLLRLKGTGTVDLPNRYVNYRLIPSVVATLQGQGGKDKAGLDIPVIVEGNFEKLKFTPDLASIAEDALKDPEKIKDTVKTIKESIKKDNVKDLLKGFR